VYFNVSDEIIAHKKKFYINVSAFEENNQYSIFEFVKSILTKIKMKAINILILCILMQFFGSFEENIYAQDKILSFENITVDNGLSQNTIRGIVKDKYGFMWFGTWEGVCRYDGYNFKIFRADENDSTALSNNRINYLFKDSNDVIWVTTGDQLNWRYNYETENFTKFTYDEVPAYINRGLSRIGNYSRTHAGNSQYNWAVSKGNRELIQTNKLTLSQVVYKKNPFDGRSLSGDILTDIYLDNTDILWVGTENGGVNKADTRAKPFENYSHSPVSDNSLIDDVIRAICEDKSGNIWVGTHDKGITVIDLKRNRFTHIQNKENTQNPLTGNEIRSLYCDRFGNIWIGTKRGLTRYNPASKEYTQYGRNLKKTIPNNWVFWIMEDHNGYLWIGTFNGIAKYNRKNDSFFAYSPDSMLRSKNVRVILEDRHFNFWIATEGGGITLVKRDSASSFQEKLTPVKHFLFSPNDANSLVNNMVLTMAEDENGIIWVGTNNGLCQLNPTSKTIKRIELKSALPDNLIMGIVCDLKGHVWISHKRGITRLNIQDLSIRNYNKSDGLQGNEFTQNAYYRSKSTGKIFFGGSNGLSVFYPDSIKDNPYWPNIVFTSLKVLNLPVQINQKLNNHIILTESLISTKEITLRYIDKSFTIEFAGLHFSNPLGNKYKYKLEGFDNDWIETDGTNRIANYSNLLPGRYIFKVMAANSDGLWNPKAVQLFIKVLPPWWRSWWAYLIYTFTIILILYFSYKYVVAKVEFRNQLAFERLKAEQMHELDQMKLEFFTNVSHELRTPLSLIIDPLEKLSNNDIETSKIKGYYSLMLRNAKRLLRLVNQLLDFRKLESAKLSLELTKGDIIAFVKDISEMFNLQAKQRNIELRVEAFADYFQACFDPDKLDKILFNLISNAFKYTPEGGTIMVIITKDPPDFINIAVKDTGIGIPEDSLSKIFDVFYQVKDNKSVTIEGSGLGLALTKKLVELHEGEIKVESQSGIGSCFMVTLPVNLLADRYQESSAISVKPKLIREESITDIEFPDNKGMMDVSLPQLLIVEDNIDVRTYLYTELASEYSIIEAINGNTGYSQAIEIVPDLIISDVMMPEMDGMELCKKLKTDERTSHIPIILLTARQSEKYKIEGYETGADAYVTKPFSTAILRAQIKNLIDSRQKLRELYSKGNGIDPKIVTVNSTDEAFLNRAIDLIKENIEETDFDTEILASKLKMSQRQLYRKIKALTDQTVHDFITTIRLSVATDLLLSGDLSISEVAYRVGYTEPANFTRTFTKKYGKNPTAYIQGFRSK
jgi:signal transduction histidine kinase/ligand-binding sensor domain-containing protein/DNA-binding response OmpR family regulator